MNTKFTLLATLALTSAPIFAQEAMQLPEITLSADLVETKVSHTGANVNVVTTKEIARKASTRMADALSTEAGVSVASNGGLGQTTYLNIHGANQNNIAVNVDGIDVTDPSLPQTHFNFANLLAGDGSSVEILKGSNGAIHSGKAVGGVVDIRSARPTKEGLSYRTNAEYGSYNTALVSYGIGYKNAQTELALNMSYAKTDGFNVGEDPQVEADKNAEKDGFEGKRLSLNASHKVTDAITLGLDAFSEASESTFDEQAYGADGRTIYVDGTPDELSETQSAGARIYAALDYKTWGAELSSAASSSKRHYTGTVESSWSPGTFNKSDNTYESERKELKLLVRANPNDMIGLSAGISKTNEAYTSANNSKSVPVYAEGSATQQGIFAEAKFSPSDKLDLSVAARQDDHSDYGKFETYRAAIAARPIDGLTMKASYGTGYRTPSLYELNDKYYDAALEPETSQSLDIGVRYEQGKNFIEANYFEVNTDNLIGYDAALANPNNPYGGKGAYTNKEGETKRNGHELSGQFEVREGFLVTTANTWTHTEDPKGEQLARVPSQTHSIGMHFDATDKIGLDVSAKRSEGAVEYVYNNNTYKTEKVTLKDYTTVNAQAGYKIGDGEIFGRVENLFDEQYQTAYGFATADRAFYVGYRVDF